MVAEYYSAKIRTYGPNHHAVDWNSRESQELRFDQLLKIVDSAGEPFSLNDYGCGYGALLDYVAARYDTFQYAGCDLSAEMVARARERPPGGEPYRFTTEDSELTPADYAVASGLFNVKLDVEPDAWHTYVLAHLEKLNALGRSGFAFNLLTSYADADRMRSDLYYGDPCWFFDHCKRKFSRDVALLHDYGLYEFTIIVRKNRRAGVHSSGWIES